MNRFKMEATPLNDIELSLLNHNTHNTEILLICKQFELIETVILYITKSHVFKDQNKSFFSNQKIGSKWHFVSVKAPLILI